MRPLLAVYAFLCALAMVCVRCAAVSVPEAPKPEIEAVDWCPGGVIDATKEFGCDFPVK